MSVCTLRKPKAVIDVAAGSADYADDCLRIAERWAAKKGLKVEPWNHERHNTEDSTRYRLSNHLGGSLPQWSYSFVTVD